MTKRNTCYTAAQSEAMAWADGAEAVHKMSSYRGGTDAKVYSATLVKIRDYLRREAITKGLAAKPPAPCVNCARYYDSGVYEFCPHCGYYDK